MTIPWSDRDRVLPLAVGQGDGVAGWRGLAAALGEPAAAIPDRAGQAVFGQLVGMAAARYEVGLRTPEQGMLLRTWSAPEVLAAVPWLKAMNARGHDIYVRPEGSVGLLLLDDLPAGTLDRLQLVGLPPSAVVETSRDNFQAWVRLSWQPMPKELATAAARELAERFGGDPNAADWRHFGRLAGFTNRKPEHTRPDGLQPYVHLVETRPREAPGAPQVLARAEERLAARTRPPVREVTRLEQGGAPPAGLGEEYRRRAERLLERYPDPDYSRVDWQVCRQLLHRYPRLGEQALGQALREGSPRLDERKGRHVDDYVERTVRNALTYGEERPGCRHGSGSRGRGEEQADRPVAAPLLDRGR